MGHGSISDELSVVHSTSTSYLAAKAEMEDAPAASHYQDAGRLHAVSGGKTPFPILLPLPQGPICLLAFGAGLQMARERWRSTRGTRRKP